MSRVPSPNRLRLLYDGEQRKFPSVAGTVTLGVRLLFGFLPVRHGWTAHDDGIEAPTVGALARTCMDLLLAS
jgi:hypothetical protein